MSREIHIFNAQRFTNYIEAKECDEIYTYDVSHADDSNSLRIGLLYEAILAMRTALNCVGHKGDVSFALVVDGNIVDFWR